MVSKITFNICPMRGRGGVTPHMRTRSMRALDRSSSLSFTDSVVSDISPVAVRKMQSTFSEAKKFRLLWGYKTWLVVDVRTLRTMSGRI